MTETSTALFNLNNVSWKLSSKQILSDISLSLPKNKIIGIIGPNGAGKTSLLKCLHGQVVPTSGQVLFNDQPIVSIPLKQRAQQIAYAAQSPNTTFDVSLFDMVLTGRLPHASIFSFSVKRDHALVNKALDKMDLLAFANQTFHTLSGGEQQRAFIARSLVQEATTLLLDEPTNHLDIRHQLLLMQDLKHFNGSVIITIHDLNMAAQYCDYLVLLDKGRLSAVGHPAEVLNQSRLSKVYDVISEVIPSQSGKLNLSFCLKTSDHKMAEQSQRDENS